MTFAPNSDVEMENVAPRPVQPGLEEDETNPAILVGLSTIEKVLPKSLGNGTRLLPPLEPVIYVEAKDPSLGSLSSELDGEKYEPINIPKTPNQLKTSTELSNGIPISSASPAVNGDANVASTLTPVASTSALVPATASTSASNGTDKPTNEDIQPLDRYSLSQKWFYPDKQYVGLINLGNSCFMGSVLQVLLHTTPLMNILIQHHDRTTCALNKDEKFCFACNLKTLGYNMIFSKNGRPKSPTEIFSNLRNIAPPFRRYRQEDAHEFLRFSIDALQLSTQDGVKDVNPKLAETSWVYRLFGGQFRSRVGCGECGHNSDTFDTLLDLSVDVGRCTTLNEALHKFSSIERLEGKNKYKCEKCDKPVNALKQLTVHKAPYALCIQLKRFTPWGRKLTHPVQYSNSITLQDVMSSGEISPSYRLYGIIVHAGSTPNSGHYFAYVKTPSGRWSRMNDEDVMSDIRAPPFDHKNAYMLFYMKNLSDKETTLAETLAQLAKTPKTPPSTSNSNSNVCNASPTSSLSTRPLKRKRTGVIDSDPEDEDIGKPVYSAALLPSSIASTSASTSAYPSTFSPGLNPSPNKKPRLGDVRTPLGMLRPSVTNGIVFAGKANGVNGVNGTSSITSPTAIRNILKVTTKKLDLPGAASDSEAEAEAEDEDDAKVKDKNDKGKQKDQGSHISLPSPISPVKAGSKPWQLEDHEPESTAITTPTPGSKPEGPETEPPSSSTTTEIEAAVPSSNSSNPSNPSTSSSLGLGLKERDGTMRVKNPNKVYQSKSKKEQRGTNPYGMLGLGGSSGGSGSGGGGSRVAGTGYVLGNKKRRPGL